MKLPQILTVFSLAAFLLTGCATVIGTLEVDIENPGASTWAPALVSTVQPTGPQPVVTDAGGEIPTEAHTGAVSGQVCYPGESIPAMTAFFQDTASGQVTELKIPENQASFTVDLPPASILPSLT